MGFIVHLWVPESLKPRHFEKFNSSMLIIIALQGSSFPLDENNAPTHLLSAILFDLFFRKRHLAFLTVPREMHAHIAVRSLHFALLAYTSKRVARAHRTHLLAACSVQQSEVSRSDD